ncbi:hypothetical protein [Solibacillus daqui]|uniref:hypothetical protein n=1 Tax=Solibacillus daqui TaxID=2912187 RepID=UPI00236529AC|nr:hypothetical protein [Solibacillus daqui]
MSKRSRSNNEQSLEVLAAQFEYASVAVITIGNILATISAGITLRLLEEASSTSSNSKSTNSNLFNFEVEQMQRQMDDLIGEMQNLKRMMQR